MKKQITILIMAIVLLIPNSISAEMVKRTDDDITNKSISAGVTEHCLSVVTNYERSLICVTQEEVEIVAEPQIDISCWKKYSAKRFRQLGRVKYGNHTYTYYSEKVLRGGGLKIPDRHNEVIDGLEFVCDKDGYIVVACDFLRRGSIVDTPVGRKGKVYDCGAGKNNIDLYVSW